jgi:glycosyltransferase involved in cell wall biosynthesis
LLYGKNKGLGVKTIDFHDEEFSDYLHKIHYIKSTWCKNKVPIWQKGIIRLCANQAFDAIIFTGEMYCLSTWIASLICHWRKKDVVFWGHGVYGKENTLKLFIRKLFLKLANKHLLYERRAKRLMNHMGFHNDKMYVVFNSLDYEKQKILRESFMTMTKTMAFPFFAAPDAPVVVFIGRLTKEKKLELLIEAITELGKRGLHINLLFIGDGTEKIRLEEIAEKEIREKKIVFLGAIYTENVIARYLTASDLCVSPGNIGLTAIHCMSYGTPVATHDNFNNQGPESEAILEGYNGFFFKEDDKNHLVEKMIEWFSKKSSDRDELRNRCYKMIENYYNPGFQVKVVERLLENETPEV